MPTHILYSLVKDELAREVRHLLLREVNGASDTALSYMAHGVNIGLESGTEYEMNQKAQSLAEQWKQQSGFRLPRKNEKIFEPLVNIVQLARACAFQFVYGNSSIAAAIPLERWKGLTGKNGAPYEYAFEGMKIIAQPVFPADHGLNLHPSTNAETIEMMKQVVELRNSIGPTEEFVLGGDNLLGL
jgi:hypothetical protein